MKNIIKRIWSGEMIKKLRDFFSRAGTSLPGGWIRAKDRLPKLGCPTILSFIRIDGTA